MTERFKVTLNGPAKLNGKWCRIGDQPTVTEDQLEQLEELGLVSGCVLDDAAPVSDISPPTAEDFDAAVAAKAKVLAEAVTDAVFEAAAADLIAERDAASEGLARMAARVETLEADLDQERTAHAETLERLTAQLNTKAEPASVSGADAEPAETSATPAAKTAPKKGAAAKG